MITLLILSTVQGLLQLTDYIYTYQVTTGLSLLIGTQGNGLDIEKNCIYVLRLGSYSSCDDSSIGVEINFTPQMQQIDCVNQKFNFTNFDCRTAKTIFLTNFQGPIYNISQDLQLDIYLFQGFKYKLTQTITQSYSLQYDNYRFDGVQSNKQAFSITDLSLSFPFFKNAILTPNPSFIIQFPKYNDIQNSIYDYFDDQSVQCSSPQIISTCTYLSNELMISFPPNTAQIQNNIIEITLNGFRNQYIVIPITAQAYLVFNVDGQIYYSRNYTITINNNTPKNSLQNTISLSSYGASSQSQVTVSLLAQSYLPLNSQINLEFSQSIYTSSGSAISCDSPCLGTQTFIISTNLLTFNPNLKDYQQNINFTFTLTNFVNPTTAQTVSINIKLYEIKGSSNFLLDQGNNQITFTQNSFSNINVRCQNCIFTQISNYLISFNTPVVPIESQLQIQFPSELQILQYVSRLQVNNQYYAQIFTEGQVIKIEGLFFQNQQQIYIQLENIINPSQQNQQYQFGFSIYNQDQQLIHTNQSFPLIFNYQDITIVDSKFFIMTHQYLTSLYINITSSYEFAENEQIFISLSNCKMELSQIQLNCSLNGQYSQCSQLEQVFMIEVPNIILSSTFLIIQIDNMYYPRSASNCTIQALTKYNQSNLKFGQQTKLEALQVRKFIEPQFYKKNENYYLTFVPAEKFYPGDTIIINLQQETKNDITIKYLDQNLQQNNSTIKILMDTYNFDQVVIQFSSDIISGNSLLLFDIKAFDDQDFMIMQTATSYSVDQDLLVEQIMFTVTSSSLIFSAYSNYTIQIQNNSNISPYDTLLIQWDDNINAQNCQILGYDANNYWYNSRFLSKIPIQSNFFDNNQTIFVNGLTNPEFNQSSSFVKIMIFSSLNLTAQGKFQMDSFECGNNCQICITESVCKKCLYGFYLLYEECVDTCPLGYITQNDSTCQQCPYYDGCEQCDSTNNYLCQTCQQGYALVNQICETQQIISIEKKFKQITYNQDFVIVYIQVIISIIMLIYKFKRRAIYYFKTLFVLQEIQQTILEKIVLLYLFIDYNYSLALCFFSPLVLDLIQIIFSQQNLRKHIQFQRVSEKIIKKSAKMKLITFGIYFYNTRIIYILETRLTDEKCFNFQLSQYKKLYIELLQYTYFYAYLISLFQLSILILILAQDNANQFQLDYSCFFIMRIFISFTSIYIDYREKKKEQTLEVNQILKSGNINQVHPLNE